MMKHIEDDGDLSLLINDGGELLVACSQKHFWVGQLNRKEEASASIVRSLADALAEHPASLSRLGMDADSLQP